MYYNAVDGNVWLIDFQMSRRNIYRGYISTTSVALSIEWKRSENELAAFFISTAGIGASFWPVDSRQVCSSHTKVCTRKNVCISTQIFICSRLNGRCSEWINAYLAHTPNFMSSPPVDKHACEHVIIIAREFMASFNSRRADPLTLSVPHLRRDFTHFQEHGAY